MKLPDRERRQVYSYENEVDSGFPSLVLGMFKKAKAQKKKATKNNTKKAANKPAKKRATKKAAVPFGAMSKTAVPLAPVLTRTQSACRNQLYAEDTTYKEKADDFRDYDNQASELVEIEYTNWQITPEVSVWGVQSGDYDHCVILRRQLVYVLAESSASALTSLYRAGVVCGSKEYFVRTGSNFYFNCYGYENYERIDSILAGRSTYQILNSASKISECIAKSAADGHHEMLNANQPLAAECFQTIRKSALAFSINVAAIRDKICADEANIATNREVDPEQLQKNLGGSKIIIMATKDCIIAVPTMI